MVSGRAGLVTADLTVPGVTVRLKVKPSCFSVSPHKPGPPSVQVLKLLAEMSSFCGDMEKLESNLKKLFDKLLVRLIQPLLTQNTSSFIKTSWFYLFIYLSFS